MSSQYSNFAASALTALLPASSPTAYITAGTGVKFPLPGGTATFKAVLTRALDQAREVVECTVRSGDICTITRAQEGTTALDFIVGDTFELRVTAAQMADLLGAVAIHQTTPKTLPVSSDQVVILDSADSFSPKPVAFSAFLAGSLPFTNVKAAPYYAAGDGVTDDSTAINDAITAVAAAGGGYVFFPVGTYLHNTAITLHSLVLLAGYGATLKWGGGASVQITSPTTGVLLHPGMEGFSIDGGTTATILLELYSAYHGNFRDLTFKSTSSTNRCLDLRVNTSGALNPDGERNTVFCTFESMLQEGTCGSFLRLLGASAAAVVTVNSFYNMSALSCAVYGIELSGWCDSNYFAGVTRLSLTSGATADGVVHNTLTPTLNAGVYANNFDHLAVDTFGVSTNQVGLRFNFTKDNLVGFYFQDPVAAGGSLVASGNCLSYDVNHQVGGTNGFVRKVLGGTLGMSGAGALGIGAAPVDYSSLYMTRTLDGTSTGGYAYGIYNLSTILAGTTQIGASFASTLATAAGATPAAARHFFAVQGTFAGVPTAQYGFYADSTLVGATNNFGYYSGLAAAAGRWNFHSAGTANNAYAGNSSFGKVTVPTCSVDATSHATSLVTNAAATYTVLTTDSTIIQTTAASTYTLPAAASFTGRELHIVTQFAGAVISNASNVVPIAGGAAGTAILAATAGKFAHLQSNGTNWVIAAAN